jgi:hypothetical protein
LGEGASSHWALVYENQLRVLTTQTASMKTQLCHRPASALVRHCCEFVVGSWVICEHVCTQTCEALRFRGAIDLLP